MLETTVMWLLAPVVLVLLFLFGPYYLLGVFIWWLIRTAINARYRKVTTMAYRTATETECVRCAEGMPLVMIYRDDYKKRLCESHQEAYQRIHVKEARDPRRGQVAQIRTTKPKSTCVDPAPARGSRTLAGTAPAGEGRCRQALVVRLASRTARSPLAFSGLEGSHAAVRHGGVADRFPRG